MRRLEQARAIAQLGVGLGLISVCGHRDWHAAAWLATGTCAALGAVVLGR